MVNHDLGGLVGNENASVAGGVGMSSELEESSDLDEPQIAVFKTSRKSDGMLVEPAGKTPDQRMANPFHHVHVQNLSKIN